MAELKPKLQLSNTYQLDLQQTARLLEWLGRMNMRRWKRSLAVRDLGLAERMLENISSLAVAMDFIENSTARLTPLGRVLRSADPYLSNPLTPWLVHYNLSANPRHLVWHHLANEVVKPTGHYTLTGARDHFGHLSGQYTAKTLQKHLTAELTIIFQTYTEGALSRLAYLEERDGEFVAPSTLRVPPPAFGYSLLTFAARYREGETAISIGDIASAPSSPGRIFLMREPDLRAHLERMHRDGTISIESKGHLDQVRFAAPPEAADYLRAHFEDTED